MRIVSRSIFVTMPPPVAYQKMKVGYVFEGLAVKTDTCGPNDWWYLSFDGIESHDTGEWVDRMRKMCEDNTAHYPMERSVSRDGMFDDSEMFMVYDREDIASIIEALQFLA